MKVGKHAGRCNMAIKKYKWPQERKFRDFHKQEKYKQYLTEISELNAQLKAGAISQSSFEYKFNGIQFRYPEFWR